MVPVKLTADDCTPISGDFPFLGINGKETLHINNSTILDMAFYDQEKNYINQRILVGKNIIWPLKLSF